MRAALLEEPDGRLAVRDVPVPTPRRGEALLRVRACAVDRFDLAIRSGARERIGSFPHILGHEIAGEVAALGPATDGPGPGTRVASTLYLVCGSCRQCRAGRETICENFAGHIGLAAPGGYAEFCVVPARNLVPIPEHIDFPQAAIMANAIGTPFHALNARMELGAGEQVVITGAGGGVGLHAVQIARLLDARVMAVDIGEEKLAAARTLGAELTVNPTAADLRDAIRDWTDGVGADAVLELVGPATLDATLPGLAKGGRVVIVGSHSGAGWTINPGDVYRNEWDIRGSRNVSVQELAEVVELVAAGSITPIISGTFPLEDAEDLHDRVRAGTVIGRDVLVP